MATEIYVDVDLLPQITRELLALTTNPDDVQITDGDSGKVLLVDTDLANLWYSTVFNEDQEPVKRKRGRPRKITSATVGEEL